MNYIIQTGRLEKQTVSEFKKFFSSTDFPIPVDHKVKVNEIQKIRSMNSHCQRATNTVEHEGVNHTSPKTILKKIIPKNQEKRTGECRFVEKN